MFGIISTDFATSGSDTSANGEVEISDLRPNGLANGTKHESIGPYRSLQTSDICIARVRQGWFNLICGQLSLLRRLPLQRNRTLICYLNSSISD